MDKKQKSELRERLGLVLVFIGFLAASWVVLYFVWATPRWVNAAWAIFPLGLLFAGWGDYAIELRRRKECARCKQRDVS